MKQFRLWVLSVWQPVVVGLLVLAATGLVLGWRLGPLTHGIAPSEQAYIHSITSGRDLINAPMFAPHKLAVYILFKFHVHHITAYRAISATFVGLATMSLLYILKRWYDMRIALFGSCLFLLSAWTLHVGRLAIPDVTFLLLAPYIAAAVWLYNTERTHVGLVVLSAMLGLSVYIPGFIWLLIGLLIWQWRLVWQALREAPGWWLGVCGVLLMILWMPLIWSCVSDPGQLLLAAGLPTHLPHLNELGRQFKELPKELFWHGPNDPSRWLGRLPLLDIFSMAMFAMGLYSGRHYLTNIRTHLLLGSGAIVLLLAGVGGIVSVTALMPLVYLAISGGIAFMLEQWFSVFPRNPIAKALAIWLMVAVIALTVLYHINHYFIAWSQAPATRAAFQQILLR